MRDASRTGTRTARWLRPGRWGATHGEKDCARPTLNRQGTDFMSRETRLAITGQSAGQVPAEPPRPQGNGTTAPEPRPLAPFTVPNALALSAPSQMPNASGWDSKLLVRALRRYWLFIAL